MIQTSTCVYILKNHTVTAEGRPCPPKQEQRGSTAYLDLLRLASAAAAWSSWVDLLAGTPKTALWVTSLRIRLCPARWVFGDDGGVRDPSFCPWIAGGGVVWTFGCCLTGAWICKEERRKVFHWGRGEGSKRENKQISITKKCHMTVNAGLKWQLISNTHKEWTMLWQSKLQLWGWF